MSGQKYKNFPEIRRYTYLGRWRNVILLSESENVTVNYIYLEQYLTWFILFLWYLAHSRRKKMYTWWEWKEKCIRIFFQSLW